MSTCGIYKITNMINNKVYIGQSSNIERRWKEHKSYSSSRHLRASMNLYGIDSFKFEIIEIVPPYMLDVRERYWISYYDSMNQNCGYNETIGGESQRGWNHSEHSKSLMSKKAKANASKPNYVSPTLHTKVIHKGDITSRCSIDELDSKLADGWELGMSDASKQKGAENRIGEKNGVYGRGDLFAGEKNHFFGKHHTEETIQKIRDHMPDTSANWRGRHHTEESKAKMRGPRPCISGVNNPNFGKRGEKSHMRGRKAIHIGDVEKRVPISELDEYLANGWLLGRADHMHDVFVMMGKISAQRKKIK